MAKYISRSDSLLSVVCLFRFTAYTNTISGSQAASHRAQYLISNWILQPARDSNTPEMEMKMKNKVKWRSFFSMPYIFHKQHRFILAALTLMKFWMWTIFARKQYIHLCLFPKLHGSTFHSINYYVLLERPINVRVQHIQMYRSVGTLIKIHREFVVLRMKCTGRRHTFRHSGNWGTSLPESANVSGCVCTYVSSEDEYKTNVKSCQKN